MSHTRDYDHNDSHHHDNSHHHEHHHHGHHHHSEKHGDGHSQGHGEHHGEGRRGCCGGKGHGHGHHTHGEGKGGCCKGHGHSGKGHGEGHSHHAHGEHEHGSHSHHGHSKHRHGHGDHPHHFRPEVGREVHESWIEIIQGLINPKGKDVVDIGSGAGVYVRGWLRMGASSATGVDTNEVSLEVAREAAAAGSNQRHVLGNASATGLNDASVDVVFIRAALHHLEDFDGFAREAARILRPGGKVIIQDFTEDNHAQPGSNTYPFGYQVEMLPALRERRSHMAVTSQVVHDLVTSAGLSDVTEQEVWETRHVYDTVEAYIEALRDGSELRFTRGIDEAELMAMVDQLGERLTPGKVVDADHWTIWTATKA